jgi:hypothetical protein
MMRAWAIGTSLLFLVSGCLLDYDSGTQGSEGGDGDHGGSIEFDRDDCKVENGDLGVIGLELPLGGVTVTFDEWFEKVGETREYVGFRITTVGGDVSYAVKAGGGVHRDTALIWMHPNGDSGPSVPGISNVDFCVDCEDPADCYPGGGGGDDPCLDPDGCDRGDGSGGDGDGGDGDGDGGDCVDDSDCSNGEFCLEGVCVPNIG